MSKTPGIRVAKINISNKVKDKSSGVMAFVHKDSLYVRTEGHNSHIDYN